MESILVDITTLLDAEQARGNHPSAIVLGMHQTAILEAEMRPFMQATWVGEGEWPGIDRTKAGTLFDVPVRFVDDEHRLQIEVADATPR